MTTIQIIAQECKTKEGKKFTSYKMNLNGKRVDLRFRQDSEKLSVIPMGISHINVEGLQESKSSFYPRYYCTFKSVQAYTAPAEEAETSASPEMTADANGVVQD